MNTLSNVKTHGGEANPQGVRFVPGTIPEAKSSKTGVSVEYVHDTSKQWFVFRASYGRINKASDLLIEDGTYVYIPKHYVLRVVAGKRKRVLEPLISNLLFVYTSTEMAEKYIKETPALSFLSYYYNHFEKNEKQKNPPLIVANWEMENFIMATCSCNEHMLLINESQSHLRFGEEVIVIDGAFKGVRGCVIRVSGQQRVAVRIEGLCTLATAYIPSAFLIKASVIDTSLS